MIILIKDFLQSHVGFKISSNKFGPKFLLEAQEILQDKNLSIYFGSRANSNRWDLEGLGDFLG